jgi:hypothetical protein
MAKISNGGHRMIIAIAWHKRASSWHRVRASKRIAERVDAPARKALASAACARAAKMAAKASYGSAALA